MSREPTASVLLACLCAAWCKTCEAYQDTFRALAAQHPHARLVWVDIEDHADALDEGVPGAPDIENFPTLLLVQDGAPRFFGTVLPHAAIAERLLSDAAAAPRPALGDPAVQALARTVQQLADAGVVC